MASRRPSGRTRKSPRASGSARDVHVSIPAYSGAVTAQPSTSAPSASEGSAESRRRDRLGSRSGELDVDRALVPAAGSVEELDSQRAGIRRLEREGEEGVLAHALRGVERDDRLAEVGHDHLVDVVVRLRDDPALAVALDTLHRVDHEGADLHDLSGLDARRDPDADLADVRHAVLASAPADGDLDLALDLPERAVALLDDRADVARLAEADVRPHERLPRRGRERDPRHDGDPVLIRHDVDVLDVARRRHRRVHAHRHRDDGAVLRDEGDVELDQAPTVLDGPAPEHALHRFVEALVEPERLRARPPRWWEGAARPRDGRPAPPPRP